MILIDKEIQQLDTSDYWFEHTPHEFARVIEAAVLAKLAIEQKPVAWAITYDGKTVHSLIACHEVKLMDAQIKRIGGTASKMPLYAQPSPAQQPLAAAPSIADLKAQSVLWASANVADPCPGCRLGTFCRILACGRLKQQNPRQPLSHRSSAMNVASQCRSSAAHPLSTHVLVDDGKGTLRELLTDAATFIEAAYGIGE